MSQRVSISCAKCAQKYKVDPKFAGKKLRCKKCGADVQVPRPEEEDDYGLAPLADVLNEPAATAVAADPLASPAATAAMPTAPSSGLHCSSCGNRAPDGAVICTMCGFNFQTGQNLNTTLDRGAIDISPPSGARVGLGSLGVLAALMAPCFGGILFASAEPGEPGVVLGIIFFLFFAIAATFLISLAVRLRTMIEISQSQQGGMSLSLTRYVGFFRWEKKWNLSEFESVWYLQKRRQIGDQTILILIGVFLLFMGFLPGLIYWVLVFRSDNNTFTYSVELRSSNGRKEKVFSRGEPAKRDVADTVRLIHNSTDLRKEEEVDLIDP